MQHIVHHNQEEINATKSCNMCGRTLGELYPDDLCPICQEIQLFSQVKEYIRSNDVHEQDVAEHFGIPLRKVREWIREGRIQYKGESKNSISGVKCHVCGKPISFGVTCAECRSLENLQIVAAHKTEEPAAMRFVGQVNETTDI